MSDSKKGTAWTVPAGKLAATLTKLWNELNEDGADIVIQLDENEAFRKKITKFMLRALRAEVRNRGYNQFLRKSPEEIANAAKLASIG